MISLNMFENILHYKKQKPTVNILWQRSSYLYMVRTSNICLSYSSRSLVGLQQTWLSEQIYLRKLNLI